MLWYLESRSLEDTHPYRIPLSPLPFRLGRRWDLPLTLSSPSISWEHAEIAEDGSGGLKISDLGSRNGTFVNGRRVEGEVALAEGDVLHFAQLEFRLGRITAQSQLRVPTSEPLPAPPRNVTEQAQLFSRMLAEQDVEVRFQPIVGLRGQGSLGYELLGRGRRDGLPRSPAELFDLAFRLGLAAELSQLFLMRGVAVAARHLPAGTPLFVNTHPVELESPGRLLEALGALREQAPGVLVLEVHERTVGGLPAMRHLRSCLRDLGVLIAYDDFGAGQSRLLELAEAPPDVLKFDGSLVRGVGAASPGRRAMLASMLRMVSELGIVTVAEGVETEMEAEGCRELGFDAAQGFYFGRPAPLP